MNILLDFLINNSYIFSNVTFLLMALSSIYYIVIMFVFEVTSFFYSFNERQKRINNSNNTNNNSNDLDSINSYINFLKILIIIIIL